ncbi:PREDICTED: platelet glycoprotein Ib alpha chain [Wasmannia auropunctata]|uniref:platelet glycoprotein Ib alpha chain n=1 Tax=Wasmannia auropunctata TaxID=64793 RepID=UPI0005EE9DBE|nr:PREDICTED: platelet glycoprotein Ib alpha chain [Wasmannia auropunctata]
MLYPSYIWIGFFIVYGTILAENVVPHDGLHHYISRMTDTSRTGRFGFSFLDGLRQQFCQSFCTSADTMPYIINLLCAAKCPELYLPHNTTMKSTTMIITTPSAPTNTTITTSNPASPSGGSAGPTSPPEGSSSSTSTISTTTITTTTPPTTPTSTTPPTTPPTTVVP